MIEIPASNAKEPENVWLKACRGRYVAVEVDEEVLSGP